jgi:hypothetical protein
LTPARPRAAQDAHDDAYVLPPLGLPPYAERAELTGVSQCTLQATAGRHPGRAPAAEDHIIPRCITALDFKASASDAATWSTHGVAEH